MPIKLHVIPGLQLGKLTVKEKTLPSDPRVLLANTPQSYIEQASLWECECECGSTCFVSEFTLSRGKVKSCGCIRLGMRRKKFANGGTKQKLEIVKSEIRQMMRLYQAARLRGDTKEESRLFDAIVEARKGEKAMTVDIP